MRDSRRRLRPLLLPCLTLVWAADTTPAQQVDPLTGQPTNQAEATEPATAEPGPARADLGEATELVRAKDYARAELALAALQDEFPDDDRLQLLHGEVLLQMSQPARALPMLRRAVELAPDKPRAHFQLATALQATGDAAGALEEYAKEIEVNDDPKVRVMARTNRVLLLEARKEWASAARELAAVLELDPSQVQAYGDMAVLYLQAGDLDAASHTLDEGMTHGFRSADHLQMLAARYAEKQSFDSAIREFRKALEIAPDLATAERGLAAALDQSGDEQQALVHLRRYLELAPTAPDAEKVRQRIQELERG